MWVSEKGTGIKSVQLLLIEISALFFTPIKGAFFDKNYSSPVLSWDTELLNINRFSCLKVKKKKKGPTTLRARGSY